MLEEPDFVLFDLDPGEKCTLKTLAKVTLTIRDLLQSVGLRSLVKTPGGIRPARRRAAGRRVLLRDGEDLCGDRRAPGRCAQCDDSATLQRTIAKRPQDAVYLDYVQVGRGKTIVVAVLACARATGRPSRRRWNGRRSRPFARRRSPTLPADEFAKYTIRTAPARLARDGRLVGREALEEAAPRAARARKAARLWRG